MPQINSKEQLPQKDKEAEVKKKPQDSFEPVEEDEDSESKRAQEVFSTWKPQVPRRKQESLALDIVVAILIILGIIALFFILQYIGK
ncbi:MAG TPA: hypothetical protein VJG83_01810 [archaeon]|nr:hypothetical protein [archaeon]